MHWLYLLLHAQVRREGKGGGESGREREGGEIKGERERGSEKEGGGRDMTYVLNCESVNARPEV